MKIKRSQLKQIIKEEIGNVLLEITPPERFQDYHIPADERRHWTDRNPELNSDLQLWWDEVYRAEDRGEQGIPGPGGGGIPNPVDHPEEWAQYRTQLSREAGLEPEGPVVDEPTGFAVGPSVRRAIEAGAYDVEGYTHTPGAERDW